MKVRSREIKSKDEAFHTDLHERGEQVAVRKVRDEAGLVGPAGHRRRHPHTLDPEIN